MMKGNKKNIWFLTVILIIIEQGIKFLINSSYLEVNTPILKPWLYFKPVFNRDYSWFNSMLQLGVGKWIHILIVCVILLVIFLFYKFLNRESSTSKLIDITFLFIFAGASCSLIDKIYWDGSLDYIFVNGFFTFDLKDVYINVFVTLTLLMLLIDYKGIRKVDDKKVRKDFIGFILGR